MKPKLGPNILIEKISYYAIFMTHLNRKKKRLGCPNLSKSHLHLFGNSMKLAFYKV